MDFFEYLEWLDREYYWDTAYFFKNRITGQIIVFSNNRKIEDFEKIPYTPESLVEDILFGFPCGGIEMSLGEYEICLQNAMFDPDISKIAEIFSFADMYYEFYPNTLNESQQQLLSCALDLLNEFCKRNDMEMRRISK